MLDKFEYLHILLRLESGKLEYWNALNVDNLWKIQTKFAKLTSLVIDLIIGFENNLYHV